MTEELHKVIIGQDTVIEQILAAIFTGGHCLLVGVPGLAKTLLVSTIARILDVKFKRIQFTPDLMPSDITGTTVLDESETGQRSFRFVEGPVFTNILLADEINRTPPRRGRPSCSRCRSGSHHRADNVSAPRPVSCATQNPSNRKGLPAPRSARPLHVQHQIDSTLDEEETILSAQVHGNPRHASPVSQAIQYLRNRSISSVGTLTINYVARLVRHARPTPQLKVRQRRSTGGPRARQYLIAGGKAAAMDGRPACR